MMGKVDCKCKSESQFAQQCPFEKGLKKFEKKAKQQDSKRQDNFMTGDVLHLHCQRD